MGECAEVGTSRTGSSPGTMGGLVNPSEAWGMCPLKAKNLSGVDLLLTLPQVLANLHPPSTPPPAETTADPASATDHQQSVAAWEGTSYLTPSSTPHSSQSCKNGHIWKSCGCVCVAVLTGVPERQR